MPTNVIAIRRIFRIAFSSLKVIPDAGRCPTEDNAQDNAQVGKNKNEICERLCRVEIAIPQSFAGNKHLFEGNGPE
jgi:hypothetical protein